MEESKLKAFQVGECDLVAHYTAEEARQLLIDENGYDEDDILLSDVHQCTEAFLAKPTRNEEGKPMPPWGDELKKMEQPGWIGGWE